MLKEKTVKVCDICGKEDPITYMFNFYENNKLVQRTFDLCTNCQKLGFAKFENLIALAKPLYCEQELVQQVFSYGKIDHIEENLVVFFICIKNLSLPEIKERIKQILSFKKYIGLVIPKLSSVYDGKNIILNNVIVENLKEISGRNELSFYIKCSFETVSGVSIEEIQDEILDKKLNDIFGE